MRGDAGGDPRAARALVSRHQEEHGAEDGFELFAFFSGDADGVESAEARQAAAKVGTVKFESVPRDDNGRADALVNEALDAALRR